MRRITRVWAENVNCPAQIALAGAPAPHTYEETPISKWGLVARCLSRSAHGAYEGNPYRHCPGRQQANRSIAGQRTRRLRRSLRAPKDSGGRVDPFGRNDGRRGRHHCQGARPIKMDRLCQPFCNPNRCRACDSGWWLGCPSSAQRGLISVRRREMRGAISS
jgi:hypothetical protein